MDEIVSLLGANYTVFEGRAAILLASSAAALLSLLWIAATRRRHWMVRLLSAGLAIFFLGVFLATRFVAGNTGTLEVPRGYDRRTVSVSVPDALLAGDLLLPQAKTGVPALLFLPGSDVSSYRTNYARLVNEVLTPTFAELGYAMLYLDKRGIGRSTGIWYESDFTRLSEDASAALSFLRTEPRIDPDRVVVLGHSQGGWIAQLVAAGVSPPSRAISLAGPAVSVMEQTIDDEASRLVCEGASEKVARDQAVALIEEVRASSAKAPRGRLRQFARISDYRPDSALVSVRVPLLLLFGGNDRLVPPDRNLARLKDIFQGAPPPQISTAVVPGVNHAFRIAERCHTGSQRTLRYSPSLSKEIRTFLERDPARGSS